MKAKAERDLGRLREQLQLAQEALGEPSLEDVERGGYGTLRTTDRLKGMFWLFSSLWKSYEELEELLVKLYL